MKANIRTICSQKALSTIRDFLNDFLQSLDISTSEINQIVLAMDEAVSNAIIHGNNSDESKILEVDINVVDNKIKIVLSDIGFLDLAKRDAKVEKALADIIKEKQKGGLGLKLIHSIMDIVTFYTKDGRSFLMMQKFL
ncbi:MAG: ATP-binding protein, partial [Chitinophagales bacterium]